MLYCLLHIGTVDGHCPAEVSVTDIDINRPLLTRQLEEESLNLWQVAGQRIVRKFQHILQCCISINRQGSHFVFFFQPMKSQNTSQHLFSENVIFCQGIFIRLKIGILSECNL